MTLARTINTALVLTITGVDGDLKFAIDVDPALGFPNGLRCTPLVMTTNGLVDPGPSFLLSAVPRTLSGITALQGSNLFKDIYNFWKTSSGYA